MLFRSSREVLLAKLAGAMKASMAKAARAFDALRIKREAEAGAPAAPVAATPAAEATAEVVAEAQAETSAEPAQAEVTTETSEPTENA